ncbi:MAG: phenylalanine--tRNA ligase subunit beta, partial [Planctomycetes bacterium]|nr:phenylalanine--tRNA ligase subunit beta [Planctomycetota bacterium]
MKISLNWVGRYVDLADKTPQDVLADLTMSTAEVEGIAGFAQDLQGVVIGRVLTREKHAGADKLSVTTVDVGGAMPLQIVCGAPNVAASQHVAVATVGAKLPGGLVIKAAKIRGVESFGMICSESELGIGDGGEGILVLDEREAAGKLGQPFATALGVADWVLEIDNKSINHRPDLWGHYGIARELAAIWGRPLRPFGPRAEFPATGRAPRIAIEDRAACPRYLGLRLEGVPHARSPHGLRWSLAALGARSIDLLVDLTNWVMFDLGQPLHAFDADKLGDRPIGVRFARAGERITTLDGVVRELAPKDLLITAGDEPAALAGVMGGESTKVDSTTRAILLESASFHAATVRRTSNRLGLRSDASARFEKSLDPAGTELAVHRFVTMLRELAPAVRVAGPLADPAAWRFAPRTIRLRKARLDLKLGVVLSEEQVTGILRSLEFPVTAQGDAGTREYEVGVPSFRATKDIAIEDDLIEEVGRMFRYDNIAELPLRSVVAVPQREPELWLCRALGTLAATELGAHEVYDYSFVPDALLAACGVAEHPYVRVTNPVTPEATRMRRHVMPSLLGNLADNLRRQSEVFLFEDGKGYQPETQDAHGLPSERRELAFAWARKGGANPYAELRAGIESILARCGYPASATRRVEAPLPFVHPGRNACLERAGVVVGYVGLLHPKVQRALGLDAELAIANLDIRALLASGAESPRYRAIPAYPSQPVDVALIVAQSRSVAEFETFLRALGQEGDENLVRELRLFETYVGEGIPSGQKSLNFTVTLGSA